MATLERGTKFRYVLILLLLLTSVCLAFYYYFQNTRNLKNKLIQNKQVIDQLQNEQNKCASLLSQQSGNFGDYEYCRKFLDSFPVEQ